MHDHDPDDARTSPALAERLETLAGWIGELDARVRAAELASGDPKTAKELRKAVEAIAKHDPKFQEKITNHVSVLTDRVATLAGTVSTAAAALAGKDGEIAALRRDLTEATARVELVAAEVRGGSRGDELEQLRRVVARMQSERASAPADKQLAAIDEKVRLLTERVDSVSATVSTTTATIAGSEGELVALRRRVDEEGVRLATAVAELRQAIDPTPVQELREAVDTIARQSAALEQETRRGLVTLGVDVEGVGARVTEVVASLASRDAEVAELREHVQRRGQTVESLGEGIERASGELARIDARVDAVDAALEAVTSAQSRERSEVTTLAQRFESGSAKVEGLVRELQAALETMPAGPDPRLAGEVEAVSERLVALAAEVDTIAEEQGAGRATASDVEQLRALVQDVQERVASQARELATVVEQIVSGKAELATIAGELREAMDALPTGSDPELHAALETQEGRLAALADDVRRLATTSDAKVEGLTHDLGALRAEIGATHSAVEAGRVSAAGESERMDALVDELGARVGSSERALETLAAHVDVGTARMEALVRELQDAMPTGPHPALVDALEEQRTALASLTAEVERMAVTADASRTGAAEDSERIRALVEALAARLGSTERELAGLAAQQVADRVDELAARLEAVERQEAERANSLEPIAGAGRLQVELRALELRTEHAEAAVRESRDTVLEQLGRLASRIEERLRALEAQAEPELEALGYPPPLTEGRVVAIRTGEV